MNGELMPFSDFAILGQTAGFVLFLKQLAIDEKKRSLIYLWTNKKRLFESSLKRIFNRYGIEI